MLNDVFKAIAKEVQKAIKEVKSRKNMQLVADDVASIIKTRVRKKMKGVPTPGGNLTRLKKLEQSTINRRKKRKAFLHPETTPAKSNLTETGQMLDGIYGTTTFLGSAKVGIKGSRNDSNLSNEKVASYVSTDRRFMDLSKSEIKDQEKKTKIKFKDELIKNLKNIKDI